MQDQCEGDGYRQHGNHRCHNSAKNDRITVQHVDPSEVTGVANLGADA